MEDKTRAVRFMRALRRIEHGCRHSGIAEELPRGHFEALLAIHLYICHNGGPLRIGMLSDQMERPVPAISRWVGELEQRGLVRRFSGEDRRTVYVEPTEEGRAMVNRGWKKLLSSAEDVLTEMGDEDAEHLIGLMEQAGELFHTSNEEDA